MRVQPLNADGLHSTPEEQGNLLHAHGRGRRMCHPHINPFDSTAVDPAGEVCFRWNLMDLIRSRCSVVFRIDAEYGSCRSCVRRCAWLPVTAVGILLRPNDISRAVRVAGARSMLHRLKQFSFKYESLKPKLSTWLAINGT